MLQGLFENPMLVQFDAAVMKLIQMLSLLGSQVMDAVFLAFTFMGEETFLVVVVAMVYWAVDKRRGEYLLLGLLAAIGSNGALKDLIRRPRPFVTQGFLGMRYVQIENTLVDTVKIAASFSFPSGHAQSAATLFSGLALSGGKKKTAAFYVTATLLVMISRVYLGVHFPTDVIAGALLGLLTALLCWGLFNQYYKGWIMILGAVVALSSLALFIDFSADTLKTIGLGAGAFLGLVMERELVNFQVGGGAFGRALRVIFGVVIILGIRIGLKAVLPDGMWFDALRYGMIGATATWLWPWAFTRLGL